MLGTVLGWVGVGWGGMYWGMLPIPGLPLMLTDKCGVEEWEGYLGTMGRLRESGFNK